MDQLIAKLHDLSYEVFGILAPGFVAIVIVFLWGAAMGPWLPLCTGNALRQIELSTLAAHVGGLKASQLALWALLAYFIGHSIHYFSRIGKYYENQSTSHMFWQALKLRPSKGRTCSEQLDPVLAVLIARFQLPDMDARLKWETFFPVARAFVQPRLQSSLISIYQHKYTLHRSLSLVAALLFWACVLSPIVILCARLVGEDTIHSFGVHVFALLGLASVGGLFAMTFAGSYKLYWMLFGNAVINEAYALLAAHHLQPNADR